MFVNGLYHDDAITNILILSLDDYQEGDVGRSDSMIMLSIDTRHKKIKMTSFTVSYTHLDVYKRQEKAVTIVCLV